MSVNNMEIVRATEDDAFWILRHRVEMFRDMGMSEEYLKDTERITELYLKKGFDDRSLFYLMKEGTEVIGGCAIAICSILPSHTNITGEFAYVYNMYVEKEYRRRGIARMMMNHLIEECRSMNIPRLYLHASEAGRSVYEKSGFAIPDNFYELRFNE